MENISFALQTLKETIDTLTKRLGETERNIEHFREFHANQRESCRKVFFDEMHQLEIRFTDNLARQNGVKDSITSIRKDFEAYKTEHNAIHKDVGNKAWDIFTSIFEKVVLAGLGSAITYMILRGGI